MDPLKVVLLIYLSILVINGVFSGISFYFYREGLYKRLIYLWAAMALNFGLQGIFATEFLSMVLCYSTYFICATILVKILVEMTSIKLPFKRYYQVMLVSEASTIILWFAHGPFWLMALPPAVGIAYPMLDAARHTFTKENKSKATQIFGILLLVNALHYLDYPFLRLNPNAAVFGFSFALAILIAISFFLPSFIVKKFSDRYASQLEEEVRARTQSLQEANVKLTEVTAENKYLLSLVCHDIASPLQIINHFTTVLLKQEAPPAGVTPIDPTIALQKMAKASRFIGETLDHVRKLHALREGKVKFDLREIDLFQVIEEVRFLHEGNLEAKQMKLSYVNLLPFGTKILGDPNSLKNNVINNLISNAIKFSHPKSEIKIELAYEGNQIRMQIRDQGVGIPQESIAKLFDSHTPTSRLGTAGERGTGFGLPIVKTSLAHFDAQIRVESRTEKEDPINHGTSFFIYFKGTRPIRQTA